MRARINIRCVKFRQVSTIATINIEKYVDNIIHELRPPVSNRLMFNGSQFKVMVVGGPNSRDDFHIQCGEELFFQLRGDMNLDIMYSGVRQKIQIGEGQLFKLPRKVAHSPQRYANTIGLVFERARLKSELDEMNWFIPGSNNVLYSEKFYCEDLGTQLKPIIENFRKSEGYKRYLQGSIPVAISPITDTFYSSHGTAKPFALSDAISRPAASSKEAGNKSVIDGEFNVRLIYGHQHLRLPNLDQGTDMGTFEFLA